MLNEPTMDKLKALRLEAMARAWQDQQSRSDCVALAFDERLAMLVEAEWTHRENARMSRSLREAKLRIAQACLEGIDFPTRRGLEKALIRQLGTCRWVAEHQTVLITGPTDLVTFCSIWRVRDGPVPLAPPAWAIHHGHRTDASWRRHFRAVRASRWDAHGVARLDAGRRGVRRPDRGRPRRGLDSPRRAPAGPRRPS